MAFKLYMFASQEKPSINEQTTCHVIEDLLQDVALRRDVGTSLSGDALTITDRCCQILATGPYMHVFDPQ
uniref:Uncharacterized protein n=1 Tax=Romanomermis culicivorax TaxID=13658 RepID=A0A915KPJ1_ROMCU